MGKKSTVSDCIRLLFCYWCVFIGRILGTPTSIKEWKQWRKTPVEDKEMRKYVFKIKKYFKNSKIEVNGRKWQKVRWKNSIIQKKKSNQMRMKNYFSNEIKKSKVKVINL